MLWTRAGLSGDRYFRALLAVTALAACCAVLAPSATAGTAVGSFEIEGNTKDEPAGEPTDWDNAKNGVPPITVTPFTDGSGQNDDSFTRGSKQNEPGNWSCEFQSAPPKDDIKSGAVGFRKGTDGKQYAYVNFTRKASEGSADLDYEFSQSSEPNPSCPALPKRTAGDIVIAFDADNGGKFISVKALKWVGDANIGAFTAVGTLQQGVNWDGATNGNGTNKTGTFGEAVLNLSDTIGDVTCGEFSSVYMKSRSSVSESSTLQDRTTTKPVATGLCPVSKLEKAVKNVTKGSAYATSTTATPGDEIQYRLTYTNTGQVPATNVTVTDPVPGTNTVYQGCTGGTSCGESGGTVTWNLGTVQPNDPKVLTFTVKLAASYPNGTIEVKNVGTARSAEEPNPTNSNEAVVKVTAAPASELIKEVRVLPSTTFVKTGATASPGNTLEYRLTYKNTGTADATGVKITEPIPSGSTFESCSNSCVDTTTGQPATSSSTSITWNLGTVAAKDQREVTFQVKLASVFPTNSTPVKNTAVAKTNEEPDKPSNEVIVTVNASPQLALDKEADQTTAVSGDEVTYTLSATNTGNAWATGVTVKEDIPAGTAFVSCDPDCTKTGSPTVTSVTWSLGTIKPGDPPRVVKLTVRVLGDVGCQVCNTAKISSPSQSGGAEIDSDRVCINAVPGPNPAGAHANGSAKAAVVRADLLRINETISPTSSAQDGVGTDHDSDSLLSAALPSSDGGSILKLGLLSSSSTSRVTGTPAEAQQLSVAETADVRVLRGTLGQYAVTADVVRAVARTTADGDESSYSSAGSTITNLKVAGIPVADIKPNTKIGLDPIVFGLGAYVAIHEEVGSTSGPSAGQSSGGTYAADLSVNAIRVHVDDSNPLRSGNQVIDVIVSQAVAHSDFPQTRLCKTSPLQAVSGHAFIASETTDPSILPVMAGFVSIPTTGGTDEQGALTTSVPADGSVLSAALTNTKSTGSLGATSSTASSRAEAANVCVLRVGTACTVRATAVKSHSTSGANGTSAFSNDAGTELLGLEVAGTSIPANPPPNTVIELPGIGFVVLNEQTCDNGTKANHSCAGTKHSGLTVRAIHVVVTKGALGLLPGVDVVVSEAHSDATYGS